MPVHFRAADGAVLRGHRYGLGPRWVILVQDDAQDATAWGRLVADLSGHGFRVLTFELEGHGASGGQRDVRQAPADVRAALSFAKAQGARRRYLIGAGSGATAALVVAGTEDVRAVVALSPRAEPSGLAKDAIRVGTGPKLFAVGSLDTRAAEQTEDLFNRSIGWAVLDSFPVTAQGTRLLRSAWGGHVHERILAFLGDYP